MYITNYYKKNTSNVYVMSFNAICVNGTTTFMMEWEKLNSRSSLLSFPEENHPHNYVDL